MHGMRCGPRDARRSCRCRNLFRAGCQIGSSDATKRPVAEVWSGRFGTDGGDRIGVRLRTANSGNSLPRIEFQLAVIRQMYSATVSADVAMSFRDCHLTNANI